MILTLEIVGGLLATWLGLGAIALVVDICREHWSQESGLIPEEVEIVTRACCDWIKTGRIDERYIDALEAVGGRKPGTWRKIAEMQR